MSAAELLSACKRIDAAAAGVRVFLIGCSDGSEETGSDNVSTRQIALRGLAEIISDGQKKLQSLAGGDAYDSMPLYFFSELVWTAEQALWVALGENGKGAPSNADLCELLGMALRFHAEGRQAWPAMPAPAADAAHQAGQGTKGGAA